MSDLATLTITDLSARLSAGECNSVDIVNAVLRAIETKDPVIQAYVDLNKEDALAQAAEADAKRAAGETGDLLGIPIGMKDLLNIKGQSCRCSSKILDGYIAPYDATAVTKLREAGAVILGRLNMDEFAMGSSTETSQIQKTTNPVNPERVPGGSSGGSAASVGGNIAIATLGSDTGGSIRQPAAFCGCVGVKPTYGTVSRFGLTAFASSLDQIGPFTKTVEDAAILTEAISGWDPKDSTSINCELPDLRAALKTDLSGVTLGVVAEHMGEGIDDEVKASVQTAIDECKALGATIKEIHLPHSKYAIACYYILATAEASANLSRFDGIRYGNRQEGETPIDIYKNTRQNGFGEEVKRRIILGTYVLSSGYYDAYYLKAQKVRALIRKDFDEAFKDCDALIGPTTPSVAFKFGEQIDDPLTMYLNDICTVPVNLAGNCGISLPCGADKEGMPIGLQVVAPSFREDTMFHVAYAYEQATKGAAS